MYYFQNVKNLTFHKVSMCQRFNYQQDGKKSSKKFQKDRNIYRHLEDECCNNIAKERIKEIYKLCVIIFSFTSLQDKIHCSLLVF